MEDTDTVSNLYPRNLTKYDVKIKLSNIIHNIKQHQNIVQQLMSRKLKKKKIELN